MKAGNRNASVGGLVSNSGADAALVLNADLRGAAIIDYVENITAHSRSALGDTMATLVQ